ncbi:hypothetical protein [Streptomyces sp. NPDC057694]|uniref:hypothetical protein n=1 Tax=unclassified Streptomyces TaxID=2593676 RepID=UPI0036B13463
MRATRHLLRTATLTTGAVAALALPVTSAFADNAPSHAKGYAVAPAGDGSVDARQAAAPSDNSRSALIAAGAGVAATGAASLGFALYRRDSER